MEFLPPINYIIDIYSLHLSVTNWIIDLRTFRHSAFLSWKLIFGSAILSDASHTKQYVHSGDRILIGLKQPKCWKFEQFGRNVLNPFVFEK